MTANLIAPAGMTSTATRCPGCGSSHTTWAATAVQDNFLCKTCGACWHPSAVCVDRVNPQQCPGCSLRRICTVANG